MVLSFLTKSSFFCSSESKKLYDLTSVLLARARMNEEGGGKELFVKHASVLIIDHARKP